MEAQSALLKEAVREAAAVAAEVFLKQSMTDCMFCILSVLCVLCGDFHLFCEVQ
jgi:hypothetical protein